ncbi:MAG: hypothetical protein AAGA34_11215 [Pseudomonadota bacterium]
MKKTLAVVAMPMALIGASSNAQTPPSACEPEPGQAFVGGPATQQTGMQIQAATGATIFQWVFEGSPVTKDYRRERVRVVYNRDMQVLSVTCG